MTTKARGFFAGALEAFVAAREAQGARYANAALLGLDDATLKSLWLHP